MICPNCLNDTGGHVYCDGETESERRIILAMKGLDRMLATWHYRQRKEDYLLIRPDLDIPQCG